MNYMDYEKISDKVMDLGYNTVLKMNVTLARKNKGGYRNHYYKEFSYKTNKYIDKNKLYNINRNFDYFLSIERYSEEKEFLMIRDEHMLGLRFAFNDILKKWFIDNQIFAYNGSKMVIIQGSWNHVESTIAMNKKLVFSPIVIHNIDDTYTQGVRISLGSDYSYTDISYAKFSALAYNINSMYLFQLAQNMLNFLQRPEFGTNLTSYSYASEVENVVEDVSDGGISVKGGSDLVLKKKKDIFDTIDQM